MGQVGFIGCHPRGGVPEAGHSVAVLNNLKPFYDGRTKAYIHEIQEVVFS